MKSKVLKVILIKSNNFSTDDNDNIMDVCFKKPYKTEDFVIVNEGEYFLRIINVTNPSPMLVSAMTMSGIGSI